MKRFLHWAVRWGSRSLLVAMALAALLAIAVALLLRTQWIREQVRYRIVNEVEKATGGKVELKTFDFDPSALTVTVKDFVLRGGEPAGDPPLAHVAEIRVGVKVVSFVRRDIYLESLEVDKPSIRIVVFPDGSNNIPGPKQKTGGKSIFEQFVALSARRFALKDGFFEYGNRRVPLDLRAENLRLDFSWERDGPRYRGAVSAEPFHFNWPKVAPLDFDATVQLTMDKNGLDFQRAEARRGKSLIVATGSMRDYRAPRLDVDVDGQFVMAEWVKEFRLPISPAGTSHFKGKLTYANGLYALVGPFTGSHIAIREPGWGIEDIAVSSDVRLDPDGVAFSKIRATALGGEFRGGGAIRGWSGLEVRGAVADLALEQIQRIERTQRPIAWSAAVSGPVELTGVFARSGFRDLAVKSHLVLEAREGKIPLEGTVNFRYLDTGRQLFFDTSYLKTPRTRVDFSGALGDQFRVLLETSDLNDFLPAAALFTAQAPQSMPVQLDGGTVRFEGRVSSPLDTPRIQGNLNATNAVYETRKIDSISADIDVDATHLTARKLHAVQNGSEINGDLDLGLNQWRIADDSRLAARLDLRKASIEQLLKEWQPSIPIKGTVSGPITVEGSAGNPNIIATLNLAAVAIGQEQFQSIRGNLRVQGDLVEFSSGEAIPAGGGRISFSARYEHPRESWNRGRLTFSASTKDARMAAFQTVRKLREDLDARLDLDVAGDLRIDKNQPALQSLNGTLSLRQVTLNKKVAGNFNLIVKTQGERLDAAATGDLLGSPMKGRGEWQMRGDVPGLGTLELGSFTLAKVNEILQIAGEKRDIPFDGSFEGEIVVSGALLKPSTLLARANLSRLELFPRNDKNQFSPPVLKELTLTNTGPIVLEVDSKGLQVVQAQLTGKETNLQLSGNVATSARNAWNIVLRGGLNLGIFQNYVPGLRTTGAAVVNATVRGTLDKPLLGGRMEIKDATVFHRDLTNGIEKANGVVAFDRNRALLQNFTAQTGGGGLKLSGFLTFGGEDRITYRINGQLERVRIRYPEGASTTVNADLSLTGTSDQSLTAGVVTVLRSGFTPRTDIGSMLLDPSKPVQSPPTSPLLRGMQFDIRVVSTPNLILETSLTQGMQTVVDLNVRGSPAKPVILGTVSVNQGELNFFGTKYTITRGTVSFFNAVRIEPIVDLDMETTVRAITVNINVSGSIDKPNITYRSDPPLQPSDIVALLTVGRTPTNATIATPVNVAGSANGFFAGTDAMLGQAVSAGVSSRLQRFFGVSRVKIDPQLSGIDTTPQARLTIEQQISRDITLTYVTNLTGTLQQIVRLQWDLRRNWSVTGVRDEYGVVGGDILYRRRFK